MSVDSSAIAALAVTGTTVVVLGYSVLLLNRLRRWGTLERALAHSVIDAATRRAFLVGISTLTGAFIALGATSILENLGLLSDAANDAITTSIYGAGAIALLSMVYNGFRVSRLTLEDELNLRDFAPAVYGALNPEPAAPPVPPGSLYVAPPIGGSADARTRATPSLLR